MLGPTKVKQEEAENEMEHAVAKATATNEEFSIGDDDYEVVLYSNASDESLVPSLQDSVDESYSSWTRSFDASFCQQSSICSKSYRRQAKRRVRRIRKLIRSANVVLFAMVALYMIDPLGYATHKTDMPLGFTGLLNVFLLLTVLSAVQNYIKAIHQHGKSIHEND